MRLALFAAVAGALTPGTAGASLRRLQKDKPGTKYIVRLGKASHGNEAAACEGVADYMGGTVDYLYDSTIHGCALTIPEGTVAALQGNPSVAIVEEDQEVKASVPWGLDRINQAALPLDDSATKMSADGVKVYIVDTGIKGDHNDFSNMIGPASCHKDVVESDPLNDGNGHGTHVASTTCGITYGVAGGCTLCAIKVLGSNGSGSMAGVVAGVNHAVNNCGAGELCVINMSLGGGASDSLDAAVAAAVNAGVVVVVAAGNSDADACTASPARAESAITVGSTTNQDQPSSFSNWGTCVDVYAPGSGITAAWIGSTSATRTISGTSMASPHVAGIAAGHLGSGAASTPAEVASLILANVVEPGIDNRDPSRTQGLATTFSQPPGPTPPPTPAPTREPCTKMDVRIDIFTDSYPEETTWTVKETTKCPTGYQQDGDGPFSAGGTLYSTPLCLDDGEYEFEIKDEPYADGICCSYGSGYYKIFVDNNLVAEGAEFGGSEKKLFGTCPSTSTAATTSSATTPATTTTAATTSPTCTECSDEPTPWMISEGYTCGSIPRPIARKCNETQRWVDNNYCQQTCYLAGRGYDGVECCRKCTECTDIATPWMIRNGKECDREHPGVLKKCNANGFWSENYYCQQSCFDADRGYDGIQCCQYRGEYVTC